MYWVYIYLSWHCPVLDILGDKGKSGPSNYWGLFGGRGTFYSPSDLVRIAVEVSTEFLPGERRTFR